MRTAPAFVKQGLHAAGLLGQKWFMNHEQPDAGADNPAPKASANARVAKESREERLARQLRENLRRRKAQARAIDAE